MSTSPPRPCTCHSGHSSGTSRWSGGGGGGRPPGGQLQGARGGRDDCPPEALLLCGGRYLTDGSLEPPHSEVHAVCLSVHVFEMGEINKWPEGIVVWIHKGG